MNRIIFVGETNPYGADPFFALYHLPRHASGNRLREHLGLPDQFYKELRKANLCRGRWSIRNARLSARDIRQSFDVVVMLGTKVRAAFWTSFDIGVPPGCPDFFQAASNLGTSFVALPHPSGLNRLWNEPGARRRARAVLASVAPDLAPYMAY